jgi:hypothetical protein
LNKVVDVNITVDVDNLILFKIPVMVIESLKQGIFPGIIVVIYLIVIKIFDSKKESKQAKISSDLYNTMTKLSNFIHEYTKNIINNDKEKCRLCVKDAIKSYAGDILDYCVRTIINNNLEDSKQTINVAISNIVKSGYYNLFSSLSLYNMQGYAVATVMKEEWMEDIEAAIKQVIFDTKLTKEVKISTLLTRVQTLFTTYNTYLINNGINH